MKRAYHNWPAFVDLLLGMLVCILCITILMAALVAPIKKDQGAEVKAEFLITATWNEDCDIDLYLEDPNGAVLNFRQRESMTAHLEFDSRGEFNNLITLADGTKVRPRQFSEVITLRSVVPGEYIVNVHLFGVKAMDSAFRGTSFKTSVTVKIQKLNPSVVVVADKTINISEIWEEQTAVRFTINSSNEVVRTSDLKKNLVTRSQ